MMSLFEIHLNPNFKILNDIVYLDEKKFKFFYENNNLNTSHNDDLSIFIQEEYLLYVRENSCIAKRCNISEDYLDIGTINVYIEEKEISSGSIKLYPEWLLFYIGIKKVDNLKINIKDFEKYIDFFRYISLIRHKKYVINNLRNYIHHNEYSEITIYQNKLEKLLDKYQKINNFTVDDLYGYLKFLLLFQSNLKNREKYKLAFNLEVYIVETIHLILNKDIDLNDIYDKIDKLQLGAYQILYDICKNNVFYIRKNASYFKCHIIKIQNIFDIQKTKNIDEINKEILMQLTKNEMHIGILLSYIELIERLNAHKVYEYLMSSIIKGIVLSVEEHIKNMVAINRFDECLKNLANNKELFESLRIKQNEYNNNANKLLELIITKNITKDESFEKYLAIYYAIRNYVAHYNIDMKKFFWDKDNLIVSYTMDAVFLILYKLQYMQNHKI